MKTICLMLALLLPAAHAQAEVAVRDDTGALVRLPQPAQRIVSLAPHASENLYAAGAGGRLVGAVDYSDFPEAAKALPRVGGYSRLDLEAIVALKPDLVVGWQSGNPAAALDKLKALGIPVYLTQPDRLEHVADNIEKLGQLAGTGVEAQRAAAAYRQRLAGLKRDYAAKPKVGVFYQLWHKPLLTAGGGQIISEVITLCGGENVFADLVGRAPVVSAEAVLAADPEAIVASGMGRDAPVGLESWRRWARMKAVARGNLFFVPSDLLQRPTPRLLDGAAQLCGQLEVARKRR